MPDGIAMTGFKSGDILVGKYRIESPLGKGGMGAVYLAEHLEIRAKRAIKVMLMQGEGVSSEAILRFKKEARAAGGLTSVHAARIYDIDELPSGDLYIVMEYVEGKTLKKYLEQKRRLSIAEAAMFMIQICEAMQEAHRLGIVHRDLKPDNLMLVQDAAGRPCVKVLDFGIAHVPIATTLEIQNPGAPTDKIMGTPYYMSPEQFKPPRPPATIDGRSDLWALGVILYEFVTGERPYKGSAIYEIMASILDNSPTPPSIARPDLPRAVEDVIMTCLRTNRDERFASASDLASALEAAVAGLPAGPSIPLEAPLKKLTSSIKEGYEDPSERASPAGQPTLTVPPPGVGAASAPPPGVISDTVPAVTLLMPTVVKPEEPLNPPLIEPPAPDSPPRDHRRRRESVLLILIAVLGLGSMSLAGKLLLTEDKPTDDETTRPVPTSGPSASAGPTRAESTTPPPPSVSGAATTDSVVLVHPTASASAAPTATAKTQRTTPPASTGTSYRVNRKPF